MSLGEKETSVASPQGKGNKKGMVFVVVNDQ